MTATSLWIFMLATAGLALTPGPNTVLTVSRSVSQGRAAGMAVLIGVELGFLVHLAAAAAGITAIFTAMPTAYLALRLLGAAYLLYVASQIVFGRRSLGAAANLSPQPYRTLLRSGFVSNALNPKTATFYLAIFPQFVHPDAGSVALQSAELGLIHIAVSTACNLVYVIGAGSLATFLTRHPLWERVQRWIFGTLIAAFAVRLVADRR